MSGVRDADPQTPSSRSSDLRRSAVSVPCASISGTPFERRARRNRPVLPRLFATEHRMFREQLTEPIAALARTAAARALVLDAQAPQREAARERKEMEDRRMPYELWLVVPSRYAMT